MEMYYPTIEYKKAALYVRCSKEEQAKFGDTIEAQTEDLKEFARQHNLQVVGIYVGVGHTARKKYNKRKEFVRMKDGISQVIINLEAQKDEPASYDILNRAVFYVSRLVS